MTPGGSVYQAYIERELVFQASRKSSLEQRGIAVITTSGALVTLQLGLVATITNLKGFALPHLAYWPLVAAAGLFVASAGLAIGTNAPLKYKSGEMDALDLIVTDYWDDSEDVARRMVTATDLKVLRRAKEKNDLKADLLVGAIVFEVVAVLTIAISVGIILHSAA